MKIAVVGNCQARPVAHYLARMCPSLELLDDTIVHLSGPQSAAEDLARLDQADVICAQSVQDGYHAAHLATNSLRSRYGTCVIEWPNLFFNGNCADLAYLTSETNERLQGPLGAYHNKFVFACWQKGIEEASAVDALHELIDQSSAEISTSVEKSLQELRNREQSCDVKIAEHIASHWQDQRLFFTFNHPTANLLVKLSQQLANAAQLTIENEINVDTEAEPLDPIIPGTDAKVVSILGLKYPAESTSKGVELSVEQNHIDCQGTKLYTLPDLIHRSYQAYAAQPAAKLQVRITPRYASA